MHEGKNSTQIDIDFEDAAKKDKEKRIALANEFHIKNSSDIIKEIDGNYYYRGKVLDDNYKQEMQKEWELDDLYSGASDNSLLYRKPE